MDELKKKKEIRTNNIQKEVENNEKVFILMKTTFKTERYEIKWNKLRHFEKENFIVPFLGFTKKKLSENKHHITDFPINISKVNSQCVECKLITNSYNNIPSGS